MDDQGAMRGIDSRQNLQEKAHPRRRIELVPTAPGIDALAIDIFHDYVRLAVLRAAAIKDVSDIGMIDPGQELAFRLGTAQRFRTSL